MSFISRRPKLELEEKMVQELESISKSRKQNHSNVIRANILLLYHKGKTISAIARELNITRPTVMLCINKALGFGIYNALNDLPRKGRSRQITDDAKAWVISLACTKPKDYGYAAELWTLNSLATHIRENCEEKGYPCFQKVNKSTVFRILKKAEIKPHKITYYVERRDSQFEEKMAQVLSVYKEVEILNSKVKSGEEEQLIATISYDEKPGIQAIENKAPDLNPIPGEYASYFRDYEYKRHGTLSLIAGLDLHSGHIFGLVKQRHRSLEFIEFLKRVDNYYPKDWKIRLILDNHSSHTSKETKKFLATVPNRFEFIFTPTHGSWLNIIETFFSKMTRSFLRGLRVKSKAELKERILKWLDEVNSFPTVFRWKYKIENVEVQPVV